MWMLVIVVLLFAIISVIFGIISSNIILKPLSSLAMAISHVKEAGRDIRLPQYAIAELNKISTIFNDMMDEIQHLINEVYEKQLLLSESELGRLRAQINPHFLFNILETLRWHAKHMNDSTIYDMVTNLSGLLRATLVNDDREKITIEEELQYIKFYLDLQQVRFGERLEVKIDINARGYYLIPRMCVVPVIENAIVHGLESKRENCRLHMIVEEKDNLLTFIISDNGVGFDPSSLDLSNSNKYNKYNKDDKTHISIGLINSNQRIKLICGQQFGISIASVIGKGTTVIITLPVDMESEFT